MFRGIVIMSISLLVAPGLGLFAASYGLEKMAGSDQQITTLQFLDRVSLITLIVSLLVPTAYVIVAALLARNRDLLARFFPPLVRVVLGVLPLILAVHGLLVWFATWELLATKVLPADWRVLLAAGFLGGGLFVAAFSIVAALQRLLSIEPLTTTGVVLENGAMPELVGRVARIAAKLGSRVPERIILGIEPRAYVANVALRLHGADELAKAETLYLSTLALRVLDDAELDALIAHELGHFRGADLEFSSRFAPAFRGLQEAADSVAFDGDDEENGLLQLARLPAIGLLSFMIHTLKRIVNRIGREREFAADRASLEVSNPQAIASLLLKFSVLTVQWGYFRACLASFLNQGQSRRNVALDYLAHTRQLMAVVTTEKLGAILLESDTPHPLDTHPPLRQRAEAAGVDPTLIIEPALAALLVDRPVSPELLQMEERITRIDVDYLRVPGHPVTVDDSPELPPLLALRPAGAGNDRVQ